MPPRRRFHQSGAHGRASGGSARRVPGGPAPSPSAESSDCASGAHMRRRPPAEGGRLRRAASRSSGGGAPWPRGPGSSSSDVPHRVTWPSPPRRLTRLRRAPARREQLRSVPSNPSGRRRRPSSPSRRATRDVTSAACQATPSPGPPSDAVRWIRLRRLTRPARPSPVSLPKGPGARIGRRCGMRPVVPRA